MPNDWRDDRIGSAREGKNPMVITEMSHGYAVMADMQFLPGWCVLLPKHNVASLNDLSLEERQGFLMDMSLVGDAILAVCDHPTRVNYDILGNSDEYLHAHIYPRYSWEAANRIHLPVWRYPVSAWSDPETVYSEKRYGLLKIRLREYLRCVMQEEK